MKVILTANVEGLGVRGDVVEVSSGYGRNYLLPRRKAMKATPGALRSAESARAAHDTAVRKALDDAQELGNALAGTRVVIAAHAGDEGKLFGSIGAADIVTGIKKFTGIDVDRRTIQVEKPIKAIGLHEIRVRLHPEVDFPLTLDVIPA